MGEIAQVRKTVDWETVKLNPNNATSTRLWVDDLAAEGHFVFYKSKQDPPPPPEGSDLTHDAFVLCIQTEYQLDSFHHLGNRFLGIDATHNVTQYKGLLLFTIMARDHWGHGVCF